MKTLKKFGLWLLWIIGGIIAMGILYLIIAIILTLIPVNSDFKEDTSGTEIFVCSNGVHTNIIIPSEAEQYNWLKPLKFEKKYKYLAFGWGDKEFYMNTPTWADLKISTALKAIFIPSSSVIQVYGIYNKPGISKNTKKICLNKNQLDSLSFYIYKSFVLDKENKPVEFHSPGSLTGNYKYFAAKGKYTLFFTCNNWTSRGLKRAGIKNAVWAPFDKSVLYHLK